MARKYSTSKSSRYSKKGRKTSTGPRRSVKKAKPTKKAKTFTKRQLAQYAQAVADKRTTHESE